MHLIPFFLGKLCNLARKKITSEEYFLTEETSEVKQEYFNGVLYAIAGARSSHNLIRTLGNFLNFAFFYSCIRQNLQSNC